MTHRSSTPSGRQAPRLRRALIAVGLIAPLLAGCSVVQTVIEGPTPETPTRAPQAPPESAPEYVAGGTAEQNLPYFTEVLRTFSAGDQPVQGQPVAQAVIDSGFDRAAMQVSYDQSKTGLAADNIFVSVLTGSECLMGQVVAEDRTYVAEVAPAVGPEGNICIIGNTRPLDW